MSGALMCFVVLAATPLGLDEVVASTGRHHPTVLAALADVDAATGDARAAAGAFDPQLRARAGAAPYSGYPNGRVDAWVDVPTPLWGTNLWAGYRLGSGSFPVYYGERETDALGELRAGLSVPLLRNGPTDRRRANIERADLGRRISELAVEQQRLELRRQAALRWVGWVAAGERRALADTLLELARARQAQLDERARTGDVPPIDALDNERAIVQRQSLAVSARRGLEQTSYELSLFYRDEGGAPLEPPGERLPASLSAPSADEPVPSLEDALARRPDVARLEAQRGQAEVEVRLQRNQVLPALDVSALVSKDLGASNEPKRSVPELELFITLEVPLLYRQVLGRLDAASANERKVDLQLQLQRERVRVEVSDALSAARAAKERARLMVKELELARRLEAGERQRLALGDSTLFLLNLRETSTFEAALREVDARADWHRAAADLAAALAETP
ncbi:MAG: TolC family protein [Myxococcaceae bacterium]|nr:TolC family protein [Myxococcaceae bacterium]